MQGQCFAQARNGVFGIAQTRRAGTARCNVTLHAYAFEIVQRSEHVQFRVFVDVVHHARVSA
jgi:hypothetical protein